MTIFKVKYLYNTSTYVYSYTHDIIWATGSIAIASYVYT